MLIIRRNILLFIIDFFSIFFLDKIVIIFFILVGFFLIFEFLIESLVVLGVIFFNCIFGFMLLNLTWLHLVNILRRLFLFVFEIELIFLFLGGLLFSFKIELFLGFGRSGLLNCVIGRFLFIWWITKFSEFLRWDFWWWDGHFIMVIVLRHIFTGHMIWF